MTKFRPDRLLPSTLALAIFTIASATSANAQTPSSQTTPPVPPTAVKPDDATAYTYRLPSVGAITETLRHIRDHSERSNLAAIVDGKTGQPITDLTTPNPDAKVNLGGYPYGVLHNGMLLAAEATGDKSFSDFTAKRLQIVADGLPYFKAQAAKFGAKRNGFTNYTRPISLDSCGAWGAAMIKARRAGIGPDLKSTIDLYADFVHHKQYRLDDGTLARKGPQPQSIWADDMYMSIPLLAQIGKLTGDKEYYDDAVRQVKQIAARLFNQEKGIYAHGWSAGNADYNPEFYWGRANGWCMMATVELLDVLPENYKGRDDLLRILRTHAKALANLQSSSGLWHQLLDKPDSYLETSCSAMFTFGLARAVNRGWISAASYGPVAIEGWNGLSGRISPEGNITGTCVGTNYASDALYYYHRPEQDDIHGYGPTLMAGAETIKLLQNPKLRIRYSRGNPVTFTAAEAGTK